MSMTSSILFLMAESPLHAGTGAHLGAVDLPIQRERHTGYPIIQGSGVKGGLRAAARAKWLGDRGDKDSTDASLLYAAFGPPMKNASEFAGALSCSDARVLLFPVRSPGNHYVWVTCPDLLGRLHRLSAEIHREKPPFTLPAFTSKVLVSSKDSLKDGKILLEDMLHEASHDPHIEKLASWLASHALPQSSGYEFFRNRLKGHLVVLPDSEFQDVVMSSTEIVTRVKLDAETKTVADGALWTEEALPTDTLLFSAVAATPPRAPEDNQPWRSGSDVLKAVKANLPGSLQIGGDETVGRGWVSLSWFGVAS